MVPKDTRFTRQIQNRLKTIANTRQRANNPIVSEIKGVTGRGNLPASQDQTIFTVINKNSSKDPRILPTYLNPAESKHTQLPAIRRLGQEESYTSAGKWQTRVVQKIHVQPSNPKQVFKLRKYPSKLNPVGSKVTACTRQRQSRLHQDMKGCLPLIFYNPP